MRFPVISRNDSAFLVTSARALLRITWARTMTPMILISVVALVSLPMVFAAMFNARGGGVDELEATSFLISRYDGLVSSFATPVIALLLGTSAYSAELEDGTLLYLVTTATPRWWIGFVRIAFAAVGTAALSMISVLGTGLIATGLHDPFGVTLAFAAAVVFGGVTYAALFTVLALLTRRALVVGFAYMIFWEGILSQTFPGLHYLSVHQWMRAVAMSITDASDVRLSDGVPLKVSLVGALIVLVAAVLASARKLNLPPLARAG